MLFLSLSGDKFKHLNLTVVILNIFGISVEDESSQRILTAEADGHRPSSPARLASKTCRPVLLGSLAGKSEKTEAAPGGAQSQIVILEL
ncbi:MAG: hypothetical protein ACKOB4_07620 [Acidobacteriota bacterium]